MKQSFTIIAAVAGLTAANSVPIFGTYPGYKQGSNLRNIEVEIFFDYLCADTKATAPYTIAALMTEIEPGFPWISAIELRMSSFPLDYHLHSW